MLNKEKVNRGYLNQVRKIWSSKLSDYNKVIAHNSSAIPVITPTVGTLDAITHLNIKKNYPWPVISTPTVILINFTLAEIEGDDWKKLRQCIE